MEETLTIGLIQSNLIWENATYNRIAFTEKIDRLTNVDIIILPEMFNTGFTMNPERVAETMTGDTIKWMLALAKQKNIAITGSLVIEENNQFFNRLLFVTPDGHIRHYDKRHTFTFAGEHIAYTAGTNQEIIEYKGWRIFPLICYDLRFPVWSRNTMLYDVLIYVANWPKPRIHAWDTLLAARAIENMSYSIGVNRVGTDQNEHEYVGHSAVYDPLGAQLTSCNDRETETVITLDKSPLIEARTRFNFLNDRDNFRLIL
ncbi:amidohydrolase [Flavobacteriaceae bacterium F08102]|nr:amidohydrolase [Flavobacteriaceae bacterium F08102]